MKKLLSLILTLALVGAVAGPAGAVVLVDYVGYAYETGGVPPSDPGDELVFAAVASYVDPILGFNLLASELTFHVYGLTSTGQGTDGFGNTIITYSGGTLDIWVDPSMDADWGINPPNASVPSTFANGTRVFQGNFVSFTLILDPNTGGGAYEGLLDGVAGTLISACSGCAYTWGGAFGAGAGAQLIEGYDLQIDGVLEIDGSVATEQSDWSRIKSLYRD